MKYLLTLVCACLLLAGCSKDKNDDTPVTPQKDSRTVIVYMASDNNLSSYALDDFNEMLSGSKNMPSDGNLILYIDRRGTSDMPCIVEIKDQKADTIQVSTSNTYSSSPDVMEEVLTTIMDKYPAEDYGLVLWGHAQGWLIADSIAWATTKTRAIEPTIQTNVNMREGYGVDNGYWMNIPTLAKVLSSLPSKFKYIFADCCCFQCAESAYELRNVTDYIIGSPAEIPACGAPYSTVVPALFDTSETFYKGIVDAYAVQRVSGYYEPLSVVKTSEMESLATATSPLLQAIAVKGGVERYNDLVYYFSYSPYGSGYQLFYDMQDLFMKYIDDENLYSTWKVALDKAVIYKKMAYPWISEGFVNSNNFSLTDNNYGGISIFIPASYYPNTYNNGIKKMSWYYATGMDEYFSNIE